MEHGLNKMYQTEGMAILWQQHAEDETPQSTSCPPQLVDISKARSLPVRSFGGIPLWQLSRPQTPAELKQPLQLTYSGFTGILLDLQRTHRWVENIWEQAGWDGIGLGCSCHSVDVPRNSKRAKRIFFPHIKQVCLTLSLIFLQLRFKMQLK